LSQWMGQTIEVSAAEIGRRGQIDNAFGLGCVVVFVMHRSREPVPMPMPMRETAVRDEYLPLLRHRHSHSHTPTAELPFLFSLCYSWLAVAVMYSEGCERWSCRRVVLRRRKDFEASYVVSSVECRWYSSLIAGRRFPGIGRAVINCWMVEDLDVDEGCHRGFDSTRVRVRGGGGSCGRKIMQGQEQACAD
jgi:hypothetical protein